MPHDPAGSSTFLLSLQGSSFGFLCISLKNTAPEISIILVLYHRDNVYSVQVSSAFLFPLGKGDHLSLGSCCLQTICPSERHSNSPGTENEKSDAGNALS